VTGPSFLAKAFITVTVSTIMRKAFDCKCSRMSMLEEEAVPQSCIP
jgi:hypothetical protein